MTTTPLSPSEEEEDIAYEGTDEREGLIGSSSPSLNGDDDERTPLDITIDKIGMGNYQWVLLCLCGLGWLADNMWVQAIAIILPRVQDHFSVPDSYAGLLSSSVFAGMMFGAVGWGTCSDILGRSFAFNGTLFFTAVFGLSASFVSSFRGLCFAMFLLGSSVGGSMPTDGTLLLEHMPKSKHHLLTFLSIFFSIGAVVSSALALIIVPSQSCRGEEGCAGDIEKNNSGWKSLVWWLGILTLIFFILRILLFRLHESPRYLVSAGRPHDAIRSLERIAKYNGEEDVLGDGLELGDVVDCRKDLEDGLGGGVGGNGDGETTAGHPPTPLMTQAYSSSSLSPSPSHIKPPPSRRRTIRRVALALPNIIKRPLMNWIGRVSEVLSPEWRRTTLVVWGIWALMSLAYTIFNVYLPKLLESSSTPTTSLSADPADLQKSIRASLWDVVIFTLGGLPGPVIGAYMVNSPRIGKRLSLAGSTFVTGVFCVVFVWVGGGGGTSSTSSPSPRSDSQHGSGWGVRLASIVISLSSGGMWAVLYGWTPEIFETRIRGSACGIASALSRIGGMIAPILGGIFLMISRSLPVYTSAVVYLLCGSLVLMLREGEGGAIVH